MSEKIRANDKSVFMLYCSVMVSRIDAEFWSPDRPMNPALLQALLVSCLHASAYEAMERHDLDSRHTVQLWDLTKRSSTILDKELARLSNGMVYGPDHHVQYPWRLFQRMIPVFQTRTSWPTVKSSQNPQVVLLEQLRWVRHEAKAFLKEFGGATPIHLALIEAIFDEPKSLGFLNTSASKSNLLQRPEQTDMQKLQQQQQQYSPLAPASRQREQQLLSQQPQQQQQPYGSTLASQRQSSFRNREPYGQQHSPVQQSPIQQQPLEQSYSPSKVSPVQSQRVQGGEPGEYVQ